MSLFFLQNIAIGAQNSLELHSGIVKLIRNGGSKILQIAGETYSLLPNDRLQTGKDTQVSVYLKNRDKENIYNLFRGKFKNVHLRNYTYDTLNTELIKAGLDIEYHKYNNMLNRSSNKQSLTNHA